MEECPDDSQDHTIQRHLNRALVLFASNDLEGGWHRGSVYILCTHRRVIHHRGVGAVRRGAAVGPAALDRAQQPCCRDHVQLPTRACAARRGGCAGRGAMGVSAGVGLRTKHVVAKHCALHTATSKRHFCAPTNRHPSLPGAAAAQHELHVRAECHAVPGRGQAQDQRVGGAMWTRGL